MTVPRGVSFSCGFRKGVRGLQVTAGQARSGRSGSLVDLSRRPLGGETLPWRPEPGLDGVPPGVFVCLSRGLIAAKGGD